MQLPCVSVENAGLPGLTALARQRPRFEDRDVRADAAEEAPRPVGNSLQPLVAGEASGFALRDLEEEERRRGCANAAVVLASHVRCRAMRCVARQLRSPTFAQRSATGGLLDALLELAVTDLNELPKQVLGKRRTLASELASVRLFAGRLGMSLKDTLPDVNSGSGRRRRALVCGLAPSHLVAELEGLRCAAHARLRDAPALAFRAAFLQGTAGARSHSAVVFEHVQLEAMGGELSIEGARVCAARHFPTVRLAGVALVAGPTEQGPSMLPNYEPQNYEGCEYEIAEEGRRVRASRLAADGRGRWYYEVVLLTDGLMQIGWADSNFECDPVRGQGVGDHARSSFERRRLRSLHQEFIENSERDLKKIETG